jgi:hypothetical protein
MTRVLAIDPGLTFGFGAVGGGRPPASGSRRLNGNARQMGVAGRHFDGLLRGLILRERPTVMAFASPFVGMKGGFAVQPDSIRPLMSICTLVEMIGDELKIRVVEVDEPEARRAFLTAVPRRSAAIKIAVQRACFERGWPCATDHAGDALCVAAWALECVAPDVSHKTTPLFSEAP